MGKKRVEVSEVIQVRVTPEMKQAISIEAERLNVRSIDVMRLALAEWLDARRHMRLHDKDISA